MTLAFCVFAATGLVRWLYYKITGKIPRAEIEQHPLFEAGHSNND
jgi:hypothetical protein